MLLPSLFCAVPEPASDPSLHTPLRLIDIQALPSQPKVCLLGQPFGSQEQPVVLRRNSAESLPDFLRDSLLAELSPLRILNAPIYLSVGLS